MQLEFHQINDVDGKINLLRNNQRRIQSNLVYWDCNLTADLMEWIIQNDNKFNLRLSEKVLNKISVDDAHTKSKCLIVKYGKEIYIYTE